MNKIAFLGPIVAVGLLAATPASANVNQVALFAGRLSAPEACFVQVDLKAVESNLFNGQEKLKVGTAEWTFSSLTGTRQNLMPGQSVLFGSEKFKTESGATPDITVPDADCAKLVGGITLSFLGSFGPEAGNLAIPQEFSELDVVGLALLLHLESQEYKVKSLTGEKTLGTTGGGGGASSSGGSSGTTSSSGSPSTSTSGGAQPTQPPAASDDSCSVHAAGQAPLGLLPIAGVLVALASLGLRRRRG
jgi:hypothetical protein